MDMDRTEVYHKFVISISVKLFLDPNTLRTIHINSYQASLQYELKEESSKNNADDEHQYEENIRHKILNASLPFVNELGWSKDSLSAGAESIGYPGVAHGMFSNGGADLIDFFQKSCNEKLIEFMKKKQHEVPLKNSMSSLDFINSACQERLKMITPFKSKWPEALATMAVPPNTFTALNNSLKMVDDIWYYSGDRSVNFTWYSRRLALFGVYKASELYFIQDNTEDFNATWVFLNNRLKEALEIESLVSNSGNVGNNLGAILTTVRNMMGVSRS